MHGAIQSGTTLPVWYANDQPQSAARLKHPETTDVCVVGAGITGLTTAYLLSKAGREVVVIDEKPVGGGETGRTLRRRRGAERHYKAGGAP